MSRTKKETPAWVKTGHAKPVTRREFLAHGIIPFAAAAFMPNWMKLLSPERVMAADNIVCPAGGSDLIPFIQLNLEGGAGLAANYVPLDQGRQLLGSYNLIGLSNQLPVTRVFGDAPFAANGVSGILTGIQSAAQTATQNNTSFIGFCVQSRDDSSENYFAVNGLTHKAGLVGTKLPLMGSKDSASGINQMPVLYAPPAPLIVKNFNDIKNSLGYTASLANLNQSQKEKLTKLVGDLNNSQARKLASISSGDQLQTLINCAGIKNHEMIQEGAAGIDPRSNAQVASLWGLSSATALNSEDLVLGSMAFNTILGQSGCSSFNKGGYDYHGSSRSTTTAKDREAGVMIGKILETARILNKPVFLMVTTDGAVSAGGSGDSTSDFASDRGSAGMIYTFLFHPTARPLTTDFQVGHYTSGQSADTDFIIGGSPELATQAVFLNWLKMSNRMDLYRQIVPSGRGLDDAAITKVVKVG